jgi:hypothetical protein
MARIFYAIVIFYSLFIHRFYSIFGRSRIVKNPNQISISQKLGILYILKTLLFNKKMYKYRKEIKSIIKSGQILGIHGGKNHKTWEKYASTWNYEKIFAEIKWAQGKIKKVLPDIDLTNFSSPAWQSSENVILACERLGFKNIYDSRNGKMIDSNNKKIRIINTELCESINGIGYIEYLIAQGYEHKKIVDNIINQLRRNEGKVILYDHPCIAGDQGIKILSSVIDWCKNNGIGVNVDE